ncbi:Lrp/AsnC family transcriptional regulator [Actinomyces vulturis]|uniref:Lrp/AsnC family transcriptional regulator n=1 Tax=Actinomyces vulturis TaxID=1857645 RepID=UPI00082B128C|nr:Lrp/AsnC family transcriptional regulator [Actinomyces vulturis]
MPDMDSLDRDLIAALRVDGRAPVAELARRLGVTRATINHRMERLEDEGIIQGFTIRVSDDADPEAIHAICQLAIEGPNINGAIRALRRHPEITRMFATNGEWDLVAELSVRTLAEVDYILSRMREIEGVYRSETSILLRDVLT